MPHAQEVVKKLTEQYDVYIATAAMDVPTSFHDKYEWLLEFFPFLDPQQFVFCGRKNVVKTDYLIDDNLVNYKYLKVNQSFYCVSQCK